MTIDADLVRRLEDLAGLSCEPAERAVLLQDLRVMVAYVERLAVFVDGFPPTAETGRGGGRTREDRPCPSLDRSDALSGAASSDGVYILTPPVRGGDGR